MMNFDICIEVVRALLTGVIFFYLYFRLRRSGLSSFSGWRLILAGFGFLFVACLLDITDNVPGLERYVVIGDTVPQAILEKIFGYLVSSVLILAGFIKLMPLNEEIGRTRDELRVSEKRYRNLVESANSIILRWDSRGKVLFLNRFGQELFGFSAEEIVGKHVVGTIVPRVSSGGVDLAATIDEIIQNSDEFSLNENENICRDGRRIWVQWSNRAFYDEQGRVVEILSVGTDVTRRRELEAELKQAQKLEALGTLAGGIAHDFNNILSGIMGYAELALMEAPKGSRLERFLSQIDAAVIRARNLIRQILMFSRKSNEEKKPIRLDLILDEALSLLRGTIPSTIVIEKEVEANPVVLADPDQVHQIIVNLVTNAFHALNDGKGHITVRLSQEPLDREHPLVNDENGLKPGDYAVLEVEDDGAGMDQKTAQKIFDPYFSTKSKEKGTGLGLAVVHGIVKSHHGHITVASAPGRGALFRVFFPLAEERRQAEQPSRLPPVGSSDAQGEKVVFVDDEKLIRDLAGEFFRKSGYDIRLFAGGEEAMEFLADPENPCDLLITDLTMPGMTGEELLQQVKEARPRLPVILCTGFHEKMDGARALATGASAFLNKPFSFPELLVQVKELLAPSR